MHQICSKSSPVLIQSVLVLVVLAEPGSVYGPGGEFRVLITWYNLFVETKARQAN